MTCKDCKNYEKCNATKKIEFEIYDDGWLDEPHLCTYVEQICRKFERSEQ